MFGRRGMRGPVPAGEPGVISLDAAVCGQEVRLAAVRGGRQFQHRLAEMGLIPGARFRIVSRGRPGPFVIDLKGGRLMLGYGMVRRVFVKPV
jgi:Fe2+ transport system protein FeoA